MEQETRSKRDKMESIRSYLYRRERRGRKEEKGRREETGEGREARGGEGQTGEAPMNSLKGRGSSDR